jgi:hypothetical protein
MNVRQIKQYSCTNLTMHEVKNLKYKMLTLRNNKNLKS